MPYKGDESFYIASSIQMLKTGDFMVPVYFGEIRFQKPILPYWITVLGYKIFSINLWSGRIGFLLLACALLILTYKFALLVLHDHQFALLNVFLLSSSTLFIEFSRVSMTDLPLTFFTTLGLYYFYKALATPDKLKMYYFFAFVSIGLAFSSKGFLGMLPFLAILMYLLAVRPEHFKQYIIHLFHPLYLLAFVLIAFSWYIYAYLYYPTELMNQLRTESSSNLSSSIASIFGHTLFYLRVIFTYYFPFTAITVYLYVKKRSPLPKHFLPILFHIVMTLIVLLFVVKGHKARYLLVVFPAVTLLISYFIHQQNLNSLAKKIAIVWAFLQIAVFICYPYVSGDPLKDLINYWQQHLQGDLESYELSKRETSWVQALSHGMLQPYHGGNEYVILDAGDIGHFENYEVLQQATKLQKIEFKDHKFTKTFRKILLIKPLQ